LNQFAVFDIGKKMESKSQSSSVTWRWIGLPTDVAKSECKGM